MSSVQVLDEVTPIVPAGTWNADPHHSQVGFSVKHMKISTISGVFPEVTATLEGGATPTLTGSIVIASVSTRDEARDGHLLGPDFFDAERYPEASFTATLVEPTRVVGELTLKGVTKEIELSAAFTAAETDPWGNERIGVELEGEVNRHEYGVSWNTALPGGGFLLDDDVRLHASFSFVKAGVAEMHALAISGSLRRESYNTHLLRAAEELAPEGLSVEIYDGLAQIPPYDADDEASGMPPSVADLKRRIAAADVVLIATPEYNSSIPGQLKNALDWVSRPIKESPFRGKPTAVIGASTSAYGGVWAQAELRKVLGILGARVVEGEVAVPHASEQFDVAGTLRPDEIRAQLAQLLDDLVGAANPVAAAA